MEANVLLGTGDVGIVEIIKQAKKNRIKHYFIEGESSRSETQITQSLKFLKSVSK